MKIFFVNPIILSGQAFFQAYSGSDFLGRTIFLSLILISIGTWTLLIQKVILTMRVKRSSESFKKRFDSEKEKVLTIDDKNSDQGINSFCNLYRALKAQTVEILNKNHLFGDHQHNGGYLTVSDIDVVEARLAAAVATETTLLEKNLYILATVVALAPFLGLLGTVWGIMTSLTEMQVQSGGNTNQMVLSGLSLALTTTVLGLVDAIPALIGYNYLKNNVRDFQTEMESFSHEMLAAVELQYRKVD